MAYSSFYANFYVRRQKAGAALAAVWRLRPVKRYLIAVLLLQALAWWQAIFIYQRASSDVIALRYNVEFGIDLIGDSVRVLAYPAAGLALLLLNYLFAAALSRQKDFRFFAHSLFATAVAGNFLLILVLFSVYLINLR
jgi:hypothetical protein